MQKKGIRRIQLHEMLKVHYCKVNEKQYFSEGFPVTVQRPCMWDCGDAPWSCTVFLAEMGRQGNTAPVKTLHRWGQEGKSQHCTGLKLCAWPAWKTDSVLKQRTFLGSDRKSGALYIKLSKFHVIREESLPYFTILSQPHKWLEFKIQLGRGKGKLSIVLYLNFIIPGHYYC